MDTSVHRRETVVGAGPDGQISFPVASSPHDSGNGHEQEVGRDAVPDSHHGPRPEEPAHNAEDSGDMPNVGHIGFFAALWAAVHELGRPQEGSGNTDSPPDRRARSR